MGEHTVIVDRIGGGAVLSCETLQFKNIEYPYKELNEQGIIKTITHFKYLSQLEIDNTSLVIVDNRPPEENFNEARARESQSLKPANKNFI